MSSNTKVSTFFVSEKISKVRWLPDYLKESDGFLSGSWDMPKSFVRMWRLQKNMMGDTYSDYVPKCTGKHLVGGDVTGLELVAEDTVVVSCSDGKLTLFKIKRGVEEDILQQITQSGLLHSVNGNSTPCTAISVCGKEVASVGEDGRLNIVDIGNSLTIRRSTIADSCSLLCVLYSNPQEVLTANRMGVIRIFDVRSPMEAVAAFITSCEDDKRSNYVSSLAAHPTQSHIVLAGTEEGSITVWDLRQPGNPASYLSAHNTPVTEIRFHRSDPSILFTAAECGELWQWAQLPNIVDSEKLDKMNPWLSGERTKSRIAVSCLITDLRKSINTLDSQNSKTICGGDTEALHLVETIP
ncbi:nucleoporin Nup43 [Glossina fuscipes]|uniref:Nucleoporin Nup43 n=2 Tax=Nemorhina TaxID=44051 RepID=A0A9C6DZM9_9MUSC|nr:nucleoporin Nup43 [Glossina fuscipes]KAI9576101.1 hypothetical protein GQX74_014584 [Glossina fuscipes]